MILAAWLTLCATIAVWLYLWALHTPERLCAPRGRLRIIAGTGIGQERRITRMTATTITVEPAWGIVPDQTTYIVRLPP